MRSHQVFAGMSPEHAVAVMRQLREKAPETFRQAVDAAALAVRTRPVYMRRQPFEKRSEAVRKAMARVTSNPVADELLAIYFLECRKDLLVEWLDGVGVAHEDGTLEDEAPSEPPESQLREAAAAFRGRSDDADRDLLLRAFTAQNSVEWPTLEALLDEES